MFFIPGNVLEAFEFPEAKDAHVLHLVLLRSVGERRRRKGRPLSGGLGSAKGPVSSSMCVRGIELSK
jgi:hypothetical protein